MPIVPTAGQVVRREAPLSRTTTPSDQPLPVDRTAPAQTIPLCLVPPPQAAPRHDDRGLAVICIDGLGYPALRYAIDAGHMPNMARLLDEGWQAQKFFPGIPCTTPASMMGFTLGDNSRIPSYYWYNKATGEHFDAGDFKSFDQGFEAPARAAGNPALVGQGSLHSCLASGGTPDAHLSIDVMSQRYASGGMRSVLGYTARDVARFAGQHPIRFVRTMAGFGNRTVRNLRDAWKGKNSGFEHADTVGARIGAALTQAVETDLCAGAGVSGIRDDMKAGKPSMFIDIASYDGTAHAYGPYSPEAMKALAQVDRHVGQIVSQAERGRGYEVVFVSDHGQIDGRPFSHVYGQSLASWIQKRIGSSDTVIEKSDGGLDNLYFTADTHQLSLEDMERRHPGLIDAMVAHPGVDMVVARDGDATWAFGKRGAIRIEGDTAHVYGEDILAHYGSDESLVTQQLHTLAHMPNAGDLIALGAYHGHESSVVFDTDTGGHGGLGGGQNQSIFITEPGRDIDTSQITNSSQVYHTLRQMLPQDGLN